MELVTDTPARLLRLLSLLQTGREWPGSVLAERLEVTPRTIRRDVDRLRGLGYPVEATQGAAGGYRLGSGQAMPPLLLDDDEAVAIAVGLRTSASHAVEGIEEASVRALAKLQQILPSRLRYRVDALVGATAPIPAGDTPLVDIADLTEIAGAVTARQTLRFGYLAADGSQTRRHVEPYRLVPTRRRWYLVAYDPDRADWRVFRLDRVAAPMATGMRFPERETPFEDAVAYVNDRIAGLKAGT
ncbi:hypothetical protein GCM10009839_29230 [Catenulispora yoronensis]|uniref:HTH deoR-type domain-containing protein n=1 Tax=Catenulispora yoronensis TaxID=450799 RepID=A0ABP5FNR8_9ACTN